MSAGEFNLLADSAADQELVKLVRPSDWPNPRPQSRYDLVVLGGGTAGLVAAAGAAGLGIGLKVALVEKGLLGGDCLNYGCVPSKALLRSAAIVGEIRRGQSLGVEIPEFNVNFPEVMARLRRIRSQLAPLDSAQRLKDLGVDVFFGAAQFASPHRLAVAGETLTFRKAVIATGAKAVIPPIPGLRETGFLTHETVFSLTRLPPSLAIIGAGPIGCELAQAFARLGAEVTLYQRGPRLLPREDPEASALLERVFKQEGIRLCLGAQIEKIKPGAGGKVIHCQNQTQTVKEILVAAGRAPNLGALNLEAAGVAYTAQGLTVNPYLQTSQSHIYGAGDVCLTEKFTHSADASARLALKNAFFSPLGWGRGKFSEIVIPHVTYTDPEIAQVGDCSPQFQSLTIPLTQVDRAATEGETQGFIKVHYQKGGRIIGATAAGPVAGELISELTLAITHKISLGQLANIVHPYPTQGEVIKKAADAYRKTLLTPGARRMLTWLSRWA
ncbi:MAG: FAD-containing oxidoreductase [Cyanobacteria bacterium RI_101]|nr:FAD-containing oxidoreductase [Cyanobacteria bacterium RI_101]